MPGGPKMNADYGNPLFLRSRLYPNVTSRTRRLSRMHEFEMMRIIIDAEVLGTCFYLFAHRFIGIPFGELKCSGTREGLDTRRAVEKALGTRTGDVQ
jgi:hypothetical protein